MKERPFNLLKAGAEELVAEIKRLRSLAERGLAQFFILLTEVEAHRTDVWKSAGIETFDMFLNSHALCNAARYREFCSGFAKLGDPELAVRLGDQGTVGMRTMKNPTPQKIFEIDERTKAFIENHGSPPSEQTVISWVRDLEPRESRVIHTFTEIGKLRAENQQLRAALRDRDKKILDLEGRLAKVKKKVKKSSEVMIVDPS